AASRCRRTCPYRSRALRQSRTPRGNTAMTTPSLVNWDALHEEAIDTLCRYIRVDTSNPPGHERAACMFLGDILKREGIPFELYDAGDDRVSLRAVLPG